MTGISAQLVKQRFRSLQIGGVEPLSSTLRPAGFAAFLLWTCLSDDRKFALAKRDQEKGLLFEISATNDDHI